MKTILLNVPRVFAGTVRYPVEGLVTVSDDEAARAIEDGDAEDAMQGEEDLAALTIGHLKQVAAAEEIDLGDATKKADIIRIIEAARAAREE